MEYHSEAEREQELMELSWPIIIVGALLFIVLGIVLSISALMFLGQRVNKNAQEIRDKSKRALVGEDVKMNVDENILLIIEKGDGNVVTQTC